VSIGHPFSLLMLIAVRGLPWLTLGLARGHHVRPSFETHLVGAVLTTSILLGACRILAFAGDALGRGLVTPINAIIPAAVLSALAVAWIMRARSRPAVIAAAYPATRLRPRWSVPDRIMLGLAVLAFLWVCVLLAITGPSGFEAKAYMIPLGAHFAQSRSLTLWDSAYMHAYPADSSILTALLIQANLRGLIALQQPPFLVLLVAAVYAYCKRLCRDRGIALRMALGAAFVPVIGVLGMTGYSDIQGVAFATIAIWLVLFRVEGPIPWSVCAGLSASLAFNAKSLHAVPIAISAIMIAARGLIEGRAQPDLRRPRAWPIDLLLFGGFVILGTSYWLVRNYTAFGNPLYPVPVPVFSRLLGWPGAPEFVARQIEAAIPTEREWVAASWHWLGYPWWEWHANNQNFKMSSGLGLWFAVTVPPAVVLTVASLLGLLPSRPHRRQQTDAFWWTFAFACLVLMAWWLLGDRQPRYAILALVLLVAAAAAWYGRTAGPARQLMTVLVYASIALTGFIAVTFKTFDIAPLLSERGTRAMLMSYPEALDHLPAGATVINLLDRPENFFALGSRYSSRVISAPFARSVLFAGGDLRIGPLAAGWLSRDDTFILVDGRDEGALSCMITEKVDERSRNPFNGLPLEQPMALLRVIDVSACPTALTDHVR